jgi:hypothetical protein
MSGLTTKLTQCEVQHIKSALDNYGFLISVYPEVVTNKEEDQLKVAQEIMNEDATG